MRLCYKSSETKCVLVVLFICFSSVSGYAKLLQQLQQEFFPQEREDYTYTYTYNGGEPSSNYSEDDSMLSHYREHEEEARTAGLSINSNTVYTGVFQAENILIHLSQNFVNFVSSTLAWFIIMGLFSPSATAGKRKKRSTVEAVEEDETETVNDGVNIDADKVAWILRSLADTAEQFHRLKDEL